MVDSFDIFFIRALKVEGYDFICFYFGLLVTAVVFL